MSVILEFCCDADPTARLMSVTCVNCLLGSLAQISAGRAVIDSTADDVAAACIRTGVIVGQCVVDEFPACVTRNR